MKLAMSSKKVKQNNFQVVTESNDLKIILQMYIDSNIESCFIVSKASALARTFRTDQFPCEGGETMAEKQIENVINEKLTGDAQKNALDLITFMRTNEFSFEGFNDGKELKWNPNYKGKSIGCMAVAEELMLSEGISTALWLGLDWSFDDSGPADDELKEFAWAHVVNCPQEKYCKPPHCENSKNRWQIFQKEFESTCHAPLAFFNLDAKKLENIKKLLLMTKK